MNITNPVIASRPRTRPLAAGLTLAFAAAGMAIAADAAATTFTVTNCSDTGAGSLRDTIVNHAMSGDTVNFSSTLPCSAITLTSGELVIDQHDLTLTGPTGSKRLDIDGGENGRVIHHVGSGMLHIDNLTITNGVFTANIGAADGGCLFSDGSITLANSRVYSCIANATGTASAYGGGIYTDGNLSLINSTVSGSFALSAAKSAYGGGANVYQNLFAYNSTISDNAALAPGPAAYGGGLRTVGNAIVLQSTISGNRAHGAAGWFATAQGPTTVSISDSTISGNIASGRIGGLASKNYLTLSNSTIAFNQAGDPVGAGLYTYGYPLTLQSSIIADNTVASTGAPSDLGGPLGPPSGHNNLITSAQGVLLPHGTITSCPKLGPLADNGGPTQTHALLHSSGAIDTGNNTAGQSNDQRGSAYPRVFGSAADIGAYEWQGTPDDRLFVSRFESACDS